MTSITALLKKCFDAELLFTDTDSLPYEWKWEDVYEEFFKHKHLFDLRDVSEGKIIDGFVGLQSKMHSMKNIDGKESNMAKGVNNATEFNEFEGTLFSKK